VRQVTGGRGVGKRSGGSGAVLAACTSSVVERGAFPPAALPDATFTRDAPHGPALLSTAARPGRVATTTIPRPGGPPAGGTIDPAASGGTRPFTGNNPWWWLAIAVGLIDMGLFALDVTAPGAAARAGFVDSSQRPSERPL
jgi:hypothetical protein